MNIFAIVVLVGIFLGLNFRVLVLLPMSLLTIACLLLSNYLYSYSNFEIVLYIVTTVTILNVGYMLGSAIWSVILKVASPHDSHDHSIA